MAIAYVGSASNAVTGTSITVPYVSAGGPGTAILLGFTGLFGFLASSQIVDDGGNVYFPVTPVLGAASQVIYATESASPAAITTVTISGLSSVSLTLIVAEFSGVVDVRPYTVTNVGNTTSTSPSISATLSAANNWIVAFMAHTGSSGNPFSAVTGNLRIQQGATNTQRNALMDNTAASITSVTCAATITSTVWSVVGVELVASPALNIVHLTDLSAVGGTNVFTTPIVSPSSGDLILLALKITTVAPTSGVLGPPTVTGCNMTWRMAILGGPIGTRRLFIFYAIANGSTTAGAITLTWTANVNNDLTASVERVRSFDATSMINWVVQEMVQSTPTTSIHNPSMTMLSLQDAASLVYAISFTALSAANWAPGVGWNQLYELSAALSCIWKVNDNVPNWTNAGTTTIDEICAIEITAANTFQRNNPLKIRCIGAPQ